MNRSITIFIAIVLSVAIANAETQTFGVNGNFICPVEPEKAANVTVKLADVEDSGEDYFQKQVI